MKYHNFKIARDNIAIETDEFGYLDWNSLTESEQKHDALKKAINEGIDSGIVEDFNPEDHLHELKKRKLKNG